MAKSKNHTAHNQSKKAHRNGIKGPKKHKYHSRKGVSLPLLVISAYAHHLMHLLTSCRPCPRSQMEPKFLRNQVRWQCWPGA